jgi:predicted acetyltransferase
MNVTLADARATPRGRAALRRLFPLYVHDLSPHTAFYRMDERGRWRPDLFREWVSLPTIDAYLIYADRGLAGFAIVGHRPFPHMSRDRDHKLCEFFVLAAHRRSGVGLAAASAVFDRHPGSWELTILPTNTVAIAFWRAMLARYASGRQEEVQLPNDTIVWFESRARVLAR